MDIEYRFIKKEKEEREAVLSAIDELNLSKLLKLQVDKVVVEMLKYNCPHGNFCIDDIIDIELRTVLDKKQFRQIRKKFISELKVELCSLNLNYIILDNYWIYIFRRRSDRYLMYPFARYETMRDAIKLSILLWLICITIIFTTVVIQSY